MKRCRLVETMWLHLTPWPVFGSKKKGGSGSWPKSPFRRNLWRGGRDSNPQPPDRQSGTLTKLSYRPTKAAYGYTLSLESCQHGSCANADTNQLGNEHRASLPQRTDFPAREDEPGNSSAFVNRLPRTVEPFVYGYSPRVARRYLWLSQSKSLLRYFLRVAETRWFSSSIARSVV